MALPKNLNQAIEALKNGRIIALPTETVYGLAVDLNNPDAIDALYHLKKRNKEKPIAIAIAHPVDAKLWVNEIPKQAQQLMESFWPGPLTIVLSASSKVPKKITSKHHSIGIRCSSCPIVKTVIERLGNPICLTSANIAGEKDALSAKEVKNYFSSEITVFEADEYIQGITSTVIDFSLKPYKLLREGAISFETIQEIINNT